MVVDVCGAGEVATADARKKFGPTLNCHAKYQDKERYS